MRTWKPAMWVLLVVLIVAPLSGVFVIGPVELVLWIVVLALWVASYRFVARRATTPRT